MQSVYLKRFQSLVRITSLVRIMVLGIFVSGLSLSLVGHAFEPVKKPLADVDIDKLTSELQVVESDSASMTQAWWIPAEFWGSAFMRSNPGLAQQAISQLSAYGMIAVVQADITPLGGFVFYDRANVQKRLKVVYKSYASAPVTLAYEADLPDSVQLLLNVLTPMFANTMGELGKNMHIFVVSNKAGDNNVVDPYSEGKVEVVLAATKTAQERRLLIELPVDALYEPRYCPNGKPAHISWQYCPWSGKKL